VFLERTPAPFRVGVDHAAPDTRPAGIRFVRYDIEGPLPFRTGSFDVVAMLAVLEHVVEDRLERVLDDVHRVLAPGGTLVVTTPPPWTDRVLPMLQRLGAVSEHMMEDHERTFRRSELNHLFARTAFGGTARSGYFELGMNIWVVATKAAANGAKSA
jgi:SAM-dependent methyltransferase